MPMEEVVRAHTMMEKNEQVGKIVLTMEWSVCCYHSIGVLVDDDMTTIVDNMIDCARMMI